MCFKTGGSAPNAPEVLRFGSTCKEMRLGKGNIFMLPISFSRNQLSAQVALQHCLILFKLARATYSFTKKTYN